MPKITVTKLHCERKQDITGKDEPYIYIDRERAWNGKMGKGDTRNPDVFREFENSVLLELKEKDGSNRYQLLGDWQVSDNEQTTPKVLTATASGYHYKLYYTVTD